MAEYRLAEEVGFDGIMLNEHHNAPFCMQPQITVWSSILAAITKRVKIVQLGNPLPVYDNPLQFAETISMIDMISGGRLVSGIVRGAGQEQICMNANPAYNRERFDEAHDVLIKRALAGRAVPLGGRALPAARDQPVGAPAAEAAPAHLGARRLQRRDHRLGRAPPLPVHRAQHAAAPDRRAVEDLRRGGAPGRLRAGPENRGYLLRVHVQDDEQKALRERPRVPVDAGRVHRHRPPVLVQPAGLQLGGAAPRLRGARQRARSAGRGAAVREADREARADRRHAAAGDRQPAGRAREHAAGHPDALGQRRQDRPRGLDALHRADGQGGPARACARSAASSDSTTRSRSTRRSASI